MIKEIVRCKNPEILAITPLGRGHKISPETKKTLKRCDVPFAWISYMGDGNPYRNMVPPWRWWRKERGTPKYLIKIDNDLTCQKGMLDYLYESIEESPSNVGYTYCKFRYRGKVNIDFDNIYWNARKLIQQNYVSSCSLMKTNVLESTGSFITDDKYARLLDWALWLQFLRRGYIGQFVPETSFTAYASPTAVSCGSQNDYIVKHNAVVNDLIIPYQDEYMKVLERLNEVSKM